MLALQRGATAKQGASHNVPLDESVVEPHGEIHELQEVMREVRGLPPADPAEGGTWAAPIAVEDKFWVDFPDFAGHFHAGGLLGKDRIWAEIFREEGVHLPARLERWLREGYWVWVDLAKMRKQPKMWKLTQEEQRWAEEHVREVLVPIGAVERVERAKLRPNTVVCNVVIAYKEGKMSRLCWSGKPINEGLKKKKFKMEAWAEIAAMAEPGDWAFSLDLEKGYLQFGLAESMKDFCVFQVGDHVYRYKVMPFGLASAPRDFSFAVKRVVAIFRTKGFRVSFFIDDLIFLAKTRPAAISMRGEVLRILHRLGLRVSRKKSLLEPGQLLPHLGLEVDLRDCRLYVPEKKVVMFKALARAVLESHTDVEGRALARVVGKLLSFRSACPAVVVFARGLMRSLGQLPVRKGKGKHIDVPRGVFQWRDFKGRIALQHVAVVELRFWLQNIFKMRSAHFGKRIEVVTLMAGGPKDCAVRVRGLKGEGAGRRLTVHDIMHGVARGLTGGGACQTVIRRLITLLQRKGPRWRGKRVHLCTDDAGAAVALGKGCMQDTRMHAWVLRLWGVAIRFGIEISAQYLAVDGIVLPGGEGVSYLDVRHDCTLKEDVFCRIWQWKGPFDVDCCASPGAVQCVPSTGRELPMVSPFLQSALHSDVLSFLHPGRLYAFPPGAIIHRLVAHVLREGLRMVMILPWWPTQPWFPRICQFEVLHLGHIDQLVWPGTSGEEHPFGQQFDLTCTNVRMMAVAFNL